MFMSKHYGLQKSLFGEIVCDDDFHKIKTTPGRMNDDGDFNNAIYIRHKKIEMMYYTWHHI